MAKEYDFFAPQKSLRWIGLREGKGIRARPRQGTKRRSIEDLSTKPANGGELPVSSGKVAETKKRRKKGSVTALRKDLLS